MNLFQIAWRNMQQRGLASVLTILSMALGVGLVVTVLCVSGIINESFQRNSNVGYNLIIGAKGSPLQLTLNSAFYLSRPVENLPYDYYLEYLPGNGRQEEYQRIGGRMADPDRPGEFSMFTQGGFAIPIGLGDYFGPFRVVATTPDFFKVLKHGKMLERDYKFKEGRNFETYNKENGYFEAVLGSLVAAEMNVKVGDGIDPSHGDPEGDGHGVEFKVVGILAPTGTPNDRAAFVNLEGFFLMEGHAKVLDDDGKEVAEASAESTAEEKSEKAAAAAAKLANVESRPPAPTEGGEIPLPIERREVTAILYKPGVAMFAIGMERSINKGPVAQAASPIREISNLLDLIIRPIQLGLLALTIIVCVESAVAILVSIYNSMSDRKRDIAVMRALGASRGTVMWIILAESILIALLGGALGWFGGHGLAAIASPYVEARTGVQVGFLTVNWLEPMLIPALMLLAVIAGLLPAIVAYRTDVSRSLSS